MNGWSSGLKLDDVLQLNAVKRYKDIAEVDNKKVSSYLHKFEEKINVLICYNYSLNHTFQAIFIPLPWIAVTRSRLQHQNINHYFYVCTCATVMM